MAHEFSMERTVAIYDPRPLVAEGICALLEASGGGHVIGATTEQDIVIRMVADYGAQVVVFGGESLSPEQIVEFGTRLVDAGHLAGRCVALVCVLPRGTKSPPPLRTTHLPLLITTGVSAQRLCDTVDAASRFRDGSLPIAQQQAQPATVAAGPARASITLTLREQEVLRSLSAGMSTREIALRLAITPNTVRTHVQHLMPKLGVHTRLQAAALATEYLAARQRGLADEALPGPRSSDRGSQ